MRLNQIVDDKFKKTVVKVLDQDTPIKTTILLKGIVELLNKNIEEYDAARNALLEKYGKKDAEGKLDVDENRNVQFDTEGAVAFNKELSELLNKEVEVPTLDVKDMGDKVVLSHTDLLNLKGLVLF